MPMVAIKAGMSPFTITSPLIAPIAIVDRSVHTNASRMPPAVSPHVFSRKQKKICAHAKFAERDKSNAPVMIAIVMAIAATP